MDSIQAIQALLLERSVSDQQDLLDLLQQQGLPLTQSTLSRKLKQLGVQKIDGVYQLPKVDPAMAVEARKVMPNLLILRTKPGYANALAVRLDSQPLPGQAGTLAGDDTIFVAIDPEQLSLAHQIVNSWK